MSNQTISANSSAIAGGAISVSLIDTLVEKGVLTKDDALSILREAQSKLQPFLSVPDAALAANIINSLYELTRQKNL